MKPTWPKLTMPELPENDWIASTSTSATMKFTITRRSAGLASALPSTAISTSGTAKSAVREPFGRNGVFICLRRTHEQPVGPEVEDHDHDCEREGVAEAEHLVRERASSPTSIAASTNPPTTAPVSEPRPPITLAMKAFSTGMKPIVGSTVRGGRG